MVYIASASGYTIAYDAGPYTQIIKTGAFAGYEFHAGDRVHITAGNGARLGYFDIDGDYGDGQDPDFIAILGYWDGVTWGADDCDDATLSVESAAAGATLAGRILRLN